MRLPEREVCMFLIAAVTVALGTICANSSFERTQPEEHRRVVEHLVTQSVMFGE